MYKALILSFLLIIFSVTLYADTNISKEHNKKIDSNISKLKRIEKQVKEQMELEKKYAKQQSFTQGEDYDLKAVEVNRALLDSIPVIEPDYDFDMTDVYRDDL